MSTVSYTITLTTAEFDAVLAGLRTLQNALDHNEITPDDGDIGDILTCGGEHAGMTAEEIGELCERVNEGDYGLHHLR